MNGNLPYNTKFANFGIAIYSYSAGDSEYSFSLASYSTMLHCMKIILSILLFFKCTLSARLQLGRYGMQNQAVETCEKYDDNKKQT